MPLFEEVEINLTLQMKLKKFKHNIMVKKSQWNIGENSTGLIFMS